MSSHMLQTTLLIFSAILICFLIYNYISHSDEDADADFSAPSPMKNDVGIEKEGFDNYPYSPVDADIPNKDKDNITKQPVPQNEGSTLKPAMNKNPKKKCPPKSSLTSEDLLPKNAANTKWAQVNPAGQGDLSDQNFLNATYHVGINTQGGSLRNSNYGLRSEPPNPQMKVSPWMQTTITPDLNRLPLEIGTSN
jgi:hypothetical protein